MELDQARMQAALKALMEAVPKGACLQLVSFVPQVGFGDDGAKLVHAFVLGDTTEDCQRAGQIIRKGLAAAKNEYGLVDNFLRNEPMPELRIAMPTVIE